MNKMTLQAVHDDGARRRIPLSERIVDENLGGYRHVPQQRQRPRPATADAGALGSRSTSLAEQHPSDDVGDVPIQDRTARRTRRGAGSVEHDQELADVAWLQAWSYADLLVSRGFPVHASARRKRNRVGSRIRVIGSRR